MFVRTAPVVVPAAAATALIAHRLAHPCEAGSGVPSRNPAFGNRLSELDLSARVVLPRDALCTALAAAFGLPFLERFPDCRDLRTCLASGHLARHDGDIELLHHVEQVSRGSVRVGSLL